MLKWNELKRHPAHKGQWDPVVWKGLPEGELWAIMFAPIAQKINDEEIMCFGLIKVELDYRDAKDKDRILIPFTDEHRNKLKKIANTVANILINLNEQTKQKFWSWCACHSAQQKSEHLMAVLRNWRSLQYNITEAFGFISQFFRTLVGAKYAIHVLLNYAPWIKPDPTKPPNLVYIMPYWRPSFEREISYPKKFLTSIEPNQNPERDKGPVPAFRCNMPENFKGDKWKDDRTRCGFFKLKKNVAEKFVKYLNQRGGSGAVREAELKIKFTFEKNNNHVVVDIKDASTPIPNDKFIIDCSKVWIIELRASHNDFGIIILPTERKLDDQSKQNLSSYSLSIARVLARILNSEFEVKPGVCLPTHRPSGSRKLAIGFADIRNFSTVTRILRLMGPDKLSAMELLIEHYSRIMTQISNEWGRLDKLMGDGLMAVFGEDLMIEDEKAKQTVCCAICFAIAAVKAFEKLVEKWFEDELFKSLLPWRFKRSFKRPLLCGFKKEHTENIELKLGVGLNFGLVHMDYFGDANKREYSAIGDNVNFCARLVGEAARFDPDLKKERAPILISQTVFEYAKEFFVKQACEQEPLRLKPKGMGYESLVYQVWPDSIDYGLVRGCLKETKFEDIFLETFDVKNHKLTLKDEYIKRLFKE